MPTLLMPEVDTIYNFVFLDGYNIYDGIYKVLKTMTYDEYVSDGGNILDDWFTPNDKTKDDATAIITELRTSRILKLVKPDDEDNENVIFASSYFLSGTPDFNVEKYYKFGLVASLGITKDPELLDFMKTNITEVAEAALGITPEITFATISEQWLTGNEYQNILTQRDTTKQKVLNYYSENLKLQKLLSQANTKIKEYEKLIVNLQKQINTP